MAGSAVVMALAVVGSGSAFAANHASTQTKAQWQKEIASLPTPKGGCYHASFPSVQWHATKCLVAPDVPLAPRLQARSNGAPLTIGNGADYSAQVTGKISAATGTFTNVSSKLKEAGQIGGVGAQVKNAFSLQLNSSFFSTPVCSGASDPSQCEGWQQFVYAFHYSGTTNEVFMQYWLLYYDTKCPSGWATYKIDGDIFCYTNSAATSIGTLKAKYLGDVTFAATAAASGNDKVTMTNSETGQASSASGSDSKLDLAKAWNTTEWGVFGDAGGAEANFNTSPASTLEAVTTLQATSSSAPSCLNQGFTGETNNLTRVHTAALGSEPSPTMGSEQTNGTSSTASCAVAS